MAKRKPKKSAPKRRKEAHPTLFVLEGQIHYFDEGSMLELHLQIQPSEWKIIVEETIHYKIFLDCLKSIAYPKLEEQWTREDEWFRLQLDVAVSRMRNIDPLLIATWNQDELKKKYAEKMESGAAEMQQFIDQMKIQQQSTLEARVRDL